MYTFLVTVKPISPHRDFLPYDCVLTMPTPSFDKAAKKAISRAEKIYKHAPIIRFEIPIIHRIAE